MFRRINSCLLCLQLLQLQRGHLQAAAGPFQGLQRPRPAIRRQHSWKRCWCSICSTQGHLRRHQQRQTTLEWLRTMQLRYDKNPPRCLMIRHKDIGIVNAVAGKIRRTEENPEDVVKPRVTCLDYRQHDFPWIPIWTSILDPNFDMRDPPTPRHETAREQRHETWESYSFGNSPCLDRDFISENRTIKEARDKQQDNVAEQGKGRCGGHLC